MSEDKKESWEAEFENKCGILDLEYTSELDIAITVISGIIELEKKKAVDEVFNISDMEVQHWLLEKNLSNLILNKPCLEAKYTSDIILQLLDELKAKYKGVENGKTKRYSNRRKL